MMTQPPLVRLTKFVSTKGGRPHRLRAAPAPSDRTKRGRAKHGAGVSWLRAMLCTIANKAGRRVWAEVDLNRLFNARGYSLSWGRELFRRVQADPFFRNLVKVRFIQKRLDRNGCFVILVARRCNLLWDEEPLFYLRGLEDCRHVRAALRGEDVEEQRGECPVSNASILNAFSSQETAVQNNGSSAGFQSSRFAEARNVGIADSVPKKGTLTLMGLNLNWTSGREMTVEGRKRIRKKALWLAFECRKLHWENCRTAWRFDHAFAFVWPALKTGHDETVILRAWQFGITEAHKDANDSVARNVEASALFHARRWLAEHTTGDTAERISKLRAGLRHRRKLKTPVEPRFEVKGRLTKMFAEVLERMKVVDNEKQVKIYKNPLTLNNRLIT